MACSAATRPGFTYFSGQRFIDSHIQLCQRNAEQFMGRKVTGTKFSGPETYHWLKTRMQKT